MNLAPWQSGAPAPFASRRAPRAGALLLAAALLGVATAPRAAASAAADPLAPGDVVARVEHTVPDAPAYVLRATLPIPPGLYPRPDGRSPFVLRDAHGANFKAQTEVVSWYADEQRAGADVVELLARVVRHPEDLPGTRASFRVLFSPTPEAALDLHADVAALLSSGSVVLRSRDVFGHTYKADLLRDLVLQSSDLRLLRDGGAARQVRTHETLRPTPPVDGPSGTLPHFLGAHAYVTTWDEAAFVSLDLRVHNGHDGLDPTDPQDDPLGKLYFRELELVLPASWRLEVAFEDPMLGDSYVEGDKRVWPLVAPLPSGRLHMMGQQAQLHRRLVISRPAALAEARAALREETLAFCQPGQAPDGRELFSWWSAATARYFPQRERLPELWHFGPEAIRAMLTNRLAVYEGALRAGLDGPFPIEVGQLGWAHPWGTSIGYAYGGDEIHFFDGVRVAYAASSEGYRGFQLTHRMSTERHPVALYDGDGDAFSMDDWIEEGPNGPYVPVYIWIYPVLFLGDPFGFTQSPDFQRQAVQVMGLRPPYEEQLLGFENIDRAHLVRYTRSPKVLAWLGNDAIAKDDLRMQAELARISYTSLPQAPNGDSIYTGLRNDRLDVDANPRSGVAMHRGEGWGIDAMAAAYCLADRGWRARTRSWFHDVLDLVEDGISDCTGILQGDPNLDTFHGDYRSRQSISAAILQNALWSVGRSVFGERDPHRRRRLEEVLERDLYASISDLVWNEEQDAVWFYVAVGPYDLGQPEFCAPGDYPADGFLFTDAYQVWCGLAYGYQLTRDPVFLTYATRMLKKPLSTPNLGDLEYGFLDNRAPLLSLVQTLLE